MRNRQQSLEKARRIIAEGDYPASRMVKRVSLEGEESDGLIILGCGHLGKGRFGLAVESGRAIKDQPSRLLKDRQLGRERE